jgi:hypothetical protein
MRALIIAAAIVLIASPALPQTVQIGPGGVRVGEPDRRERRAGPNCRELRAACLNKERLGEQGEGNCRRYRAVCRR